MFVPRARLVLWVLLIGTVQSSVAAPGPHAEEVVREFYTRVAGGGDRAVELMDADAAKRFLQTYGRTLRTRCRRLDSVGLQLLEQTPAEAVVFADVVMSAWSEGEAAVVEHWPAIVSLRHDGGRWRIHRFQRNEDRLVADLLTGRFESLREIVWPRDAGVVTRLCDIAIERINQQQISGAAETIALARAATIVPDSTAESAVLSAESVLARWRHPPDAQEGLRKALEAARLSERSPDPDVRAKVLLRLARARQFIDGRTDPEPLRRIMKLADSVTDTAVIAHAATHLGKYHDEQRNGNESYRYGLLALRYAELAESAAGQVSALLALAGSSFARAQPQLALRYFERALELARREGYHSTASSVAGAIARVRMEVYGEMELALAALAKAPPDALLNPEARHSLVQDRGWVKFHAGDLEAAEFEFGASLAYSRQHAAHATRGPYEACAVVAHAAGRFDEARRFGESAELTDPRRVSATRAKALRALGRTAAAEAALREVVADEEEQLAGRLVDPLLPTFDWNDGLRNSWSELMLLLRDGGRDEEALLLAEQWRAPSLQAALARRERQFQASLSPEQTKAHQQLLRKLRALNAKRLSAPNNAELERQLNEARLDLTEFRIGIYSEHPDLVLTRGDLPESFAEIIPRPCDTPAIEYVATRKRTVAFVIVKSCRGGVNVSSRVIDVPYDELARLIERFVEAVESGDLRHRDAARRLYDVLLAPVEDLALDTGARVVTILPDGVLWRVPFHALVDARNRHVIDRVAVAYSPSLTYGNASATTRPRNERARLLAFANASGGSGTRSAFRSAKASTAFGHIPEVENEVRALARIYGAERTAVYVNERARESVLKIEAGKADILHIASHGHYEPGQPLFSSLVLESGDGEDGLLEAHELFSLGLHPEVAVLSGCETARGTILNSIDGPIGLAWAFLAAGAQSTVVSQWKAESAATTQLMISFHRELAAGRSPAIALQRAQQRLKQDRRTSPPLYWAAFAVVGHP